jgi:type IV secretory pathway TrbD component
MTAVVSAERAARTWLTGTTGLLIVAAAFVMMVWAAPSQPHARAHRPATSTSITAQLESRVRGGPTRPPGRPAARTPSAGRP